jgi:hypothetical protein
MGMMLIKFEPNMQASIVHFHTRARIGTASSTQAMKDSQ